MRSSMDSALDNGIDFTRSFIPLKVSFIAEGVDKLARGVFLSFTQVSTGQARVKRCVGDADEVFAGVLLDLDRGDIAVIGCGGMSLYTMYYDIAPVWKIGHLVGPGKHGELAIVKPGIMPVGTVISLPSEDDPFLGVRFKG